MFSIMEDKKITQSEETPAEDKKGEEEGGEKTFSQDDLNKVVSKRVGEVEEKWEKRLADAVAKEREEAERLAKLSADEKEREMSEKRKGELEKWEKDVKLRENKLKAVSTLNEMGLPLNIVDLVVDLNDDAQEAKIEQISSVWSEALQKAVEEKLKGTPPKDFATNPPTAKKVVTSF